MPRHLQLRRWRWPAYANNRSFVIKFATANTGPTTLNGNSKGAKNVYTYPASGRDVFPQSGTPVALTGGEIGVNEWKYFVYQTALNGGAGGWLLVNPNYSMERPARWTPTGFSKPHITVDVEAVEAGLVEKYGIDRTLFPASHKARVPAGIPTFTAPRMPVQKTIDIIAGLTQGTVVGSVAVENTPTDTIRYVQIGGTSHYATNPSTGVITVATGYTTVQDVNEEIVIYAWPVINTAGLLAGGRPVVPGSNAQRVFINVHADDDFDFNYFNSLLFWLDAQVASTLTLDGSNKVLSWNELGVQHASLSDDAALSETAPTYSATGLNSRPAVVTTGSNQMLTAYIGTASYTDVRMTNLVTRTTPSTQISLTLQGISRGTNTFDHTQAHMGLITWTKTPSAWTFWGNGALVGPASTASQTGIVTNGWVAWVADTVNGGGGGLGRIYDNGRFFNTSLLTSGFNGALGEFARGDDLLDQSLIDKIFGHMAHHWGLTGLLPAAHPYKSVAPKKWSSPVAPAFSWPDATNTGATGALTAYTGSLSVNTNGTTIRDKTITGEIDLNGDNISLINCRLTGSTLYGVAANGSGCLVQNCTIIGTNGSIGIVGSGTFTGNNISGFENGFRIEQATNSVVRFNYVHGLSSASGSPHFDCMEVRNGVNGLLIEDNHFVGKDTSDILIQDFQAAVANVTINHNFLDGDQTVNPQGPGYNVYVEGRFGNGTTNVVITNNVIRRGHFGYFSIDTASPTGSGNTDFATGATVPVQ
jgi:hypothetical protein